MKRRLVPLGKALLTALATAAATGLLISDAAAQVLRRPDEEDGHGEPLLLALANARVPGLLRPRGHSSHSSHQSHRSHVSGGGGGWSGGSGAGTFNATDDPPSLPAPPPPPPKPASVSFVAYPGGRIFVDGALVGADATTTLTLKPGAHEIRVENRFVGQHSETVHLAEGQTGAITIDW